MADRKGRLRRFAAKSLVVLVGLLFGGLIAEIALRFTGYSYPIFYTADAVRGYAGIPFLRGWSWPENKVFIEYNSEGFRDLEHPIEKPANTIRVAVIGDSFTEARQVPLEASYWRVAQHLLESDPRFAGKKVEFINFGVTGYGTVEELLTLRDRVWRYSPDVVLLGVCVYNDITDNYPKFKGSTEIPYFRLTDGTLTLDDGFRHSSKYTWHDSAFFRSWVFIHNHSRLIQLIHHAQFALHTQLQQWKEQNKTSGPPPAQTGPGTTGNDRRFTNAELTSSVGIQNIVYREPDDPDWNEAWLLTEAMISEIGDEVAEHHARFLVTTITSDVQVCPTTAVRQNMMDQLGVTDLFYPNRRLRDLADRRGIAFLDLAQPMQSAAERDNVYFHGFGKEMGTGHWNEAGHKIAGELVSGKIAQMLAEVQ